MLPESADVTLKLVIPTVWRPRILGSAFPATVRVLMALGLVGVAWICVLVFTVAFHADNLGRMRWRWTFRVVRPWPALTTFTVPCRS